MPIVNFARMYSLLNKVEETNTINRLAEIYEKNVIKKTTYDDIMQSYLYLLQMRLRHQVSLLRENLKPNNRINPKKLSQIEEATLKQTFNQIGLIQKKISFDFMGGSK